MQTVRKKSNIDLFTKWMYGLITVVIIQAFCSCNNSSQSGNGVEKKPEITTPVKKKPSSSFQDTLVISAPAAVFFYPDSLQLEKIGAVNDKMVFESMKHECFYQKRNAMMVLEKYWPAVKLIETSRNRFVMFIKQDHSRTIVDLDTKNIMCGVILFNQEKDPLLADMMNIDTDAGFYFKR